MAKGKKSKGKHYVSKGERPSVNRKTSNAVKNDRTMMDRIINQWDAHMKGKNTKRYGKDKDGKPIEVPYKEVIKEGRFMDMERRYNKVLT